MTREEFIKKSTLMSLGISILPSLLSSCEKEDDFKANFTGDLLIIGAGSAGMMAAYNFARHNPNFKILEASSSFGGRVKKSQNFADFPIDLGAEWIHTKPSVFADLVDNENQSGGVNVIPYNPQSIKSWNNGRLTNYSITSPYFREHKFKNTTWYDFFEDFILPSITDKITYNSPVTEIDYSGNRVSVTTDDGTVYEADRVLITVPIKVLQQNVISFTPALPNAQINAINKFEMPGGLKVFVQFSERFYPDLLVMGGIMNTVGNHEKVYYDAAFKKDSNQNILALFAVGDPSSDFINLTDQEIIDKVLQELDEVFDGKATQYYQKHIIQNWSTEPFIGGSYSFYDSDTDSSIDLLEQGLENKLYFAGEAIIISEPATVHGAGFSGVEASKKILKSG